VSGLAKGHAGPPDARAAEPRFQSTPALSSRPARAEIALVDSGGGSATSPGPCSSPDSGSANYASWHDDCSSPSVPLKIWEGAEGFGQGIQANTALTGLGFLAIIAQCRCRSERLAVLRHPLGEGGNPPLRGGKEFLLPTSGRRRSTTRMAWLGVRRICAMWHPA
jgi:hypothetical protein